MNPLKNALSNNRNPSKRTYIRRGIESLENALEIGIPPHATDQVKQLLHRALLITVLQTILS